MKPLRLFTVYGLLLTGIFLSHALFYFSALGSDATDDAYISFRYAQNAILGHGLVFNPGERVEGFTNFLWTTMFIPLEGVRVDTGRASMLLGALFALGVIALTVRFAKMVGAPRTFGWLAAFLLVADGSFALWAVGGLETSMFAFLIFAGVFLYIKENLLDADERGNTRIVPSLISNLQSLPVSGIFFALATMTRPEGALVFTITVAHQAAWRILSERRLFAFRDLSRIFAFLALFAPYWVARWQYYHSFLPNSFHAKVNTIGPAAQITRGWNHLSQFVGVHLGWLITVPAVVAIITSLRAQQESSNLPFAPLIKRSGGDEIASAHKTFIAMTATRTFWTSYFASIILPYLVYIVYVGGDWSVGRFFVPLLAPFYLLFSTGVVNIWNWVVDKIRRAVNNRAGILGLVASTLLVIAIFIASSWNGERGIYIKDFDAGKATLARETMGKWLRTNVPRSTLIAVDAAGQVPYFSGLPAVDLFGINDLHIGRLKVETLGTGTPGHEKMDLVYVILIRQPEYVVIYGDLFDSVKEYERAPSTWTNDESLKKFLTLYQKRNP